MDKPGVLRNLLRLASLLVVGGALQLASVVAAHADPSTVDWQRLRMCESTDRYGTDTGNGYFGAYQFDLPTWRSVGGTGYPHQASPAEQDFRALYLYRMRGWQPWECAGKLGLRDDRDARSKRVPSYGEAAYMSGAAFPVWPGRVFGYGDCHPALREWQLRMNRYGYGFEGTGCYLEKTRGAVLDLQRANGIKDSGLLGPRTWQAAWTGKPPR